MRLLDFIFVVIIFILACICLYNIYPSTLGTVAPSFYHPLDDLFHSVIKNKNIELK